MKGMMSQCFLLLHTE